MSRLDQMAARIRSKNAGPFWITIDIFCSDKQSYEQVKNCLTNERTAARLRVPADRLNRFEIDELQVLKFSLPRQHIQGSRHDRDMHGAQMALLLADIDCS